MHLRPWRILAAAVVLLVVSCSAVAAPAEENTREEALVQRVAELEAQVEALRWTEEDAVTLVQFTLRERVASCEYGGCNHLQDPVLRAFGGGGRLFPNLGDAARYSTAKWLLEHGQWTGVHEPDSLRWRVEAAGGDLRPLVFHAYEKTGLVEGVAPSQASSNPTAVPSDSHREETLQEQRNRIREELGLPPMP